MAITYFNRGTGYLDNDDYDRAIADFDESLRIKSGDVGALNSRGKAYNEKGEYDRAIIDLNEAIRLDPNSQYAFLNRGRSYAHKKLYDRALSDFDQAIRINAMNELVFFERGNVYFELKDYSQAIADYNDAIRLAPNYLMAFYNRGAAYEKAKNYERAIVDFGDVIRLNPTNANARNERCWLRALAGHDLQEALADCDESLRLHQDGHTLNSRGLVQLKLGAFDRAIADYDAAILLNNRDYGSLYGRGVAKLKLGNTAGGNADIAAAKALKAEVAEIYSSYGIDGANAAGIQTSTGPADRAVPSASADCSRAETHWKSVEEIKTLAAYQDHLRRFPNCDFAGLAAARIEQLEKN